MPDNYISKFAPKSWFFAEPDQITQSAGQAFGPAQGLDASNEFLLSSAFTVSPSGSKAFAICKGVVLVQPNITDNTRVNLILRPYHQPVQGISIRYFVYRGLNKADFFSGLLVKDKTGAPSDFLSKINDDFTSYHTSHSTTIPPFEAKFIGYDSNTPLNTPLDFFFFKESDYVQSNGEFTEDQQTAFELPVIDGGKWLGNFASGECAIDVVLNYGDYRMPEPDDEFDFDLAYARSGQASISLGGLSDTQKKIRRAQIYQFLDIAAYYGFHQAADSEVYVNNGGAKEVKKGNDIYNTLINRFATKNRFYLYIQSDRTRPYNFYGTYSLNDNAANALKMGATEAAMTESAFATNHWPVLILDTPQIHNETSNKLYLQLVTDNNVNTMLYGQIAQIDNAQKDNFCDAEYLRQTPDAGGELTFTKTIVLSHPATGNDGEKRFVAGFNLLIYQGVTYSYKAGTVLNEQQQTVDVLASPNFFDDVFGQITAQPLFKAGKNAEYSRVSSQKLKLVNHYADRKQLGISAVQTLIVNDVIDTGVQASPTLNRVTYITEAAEVLNNAISLTGKITADTKTTSSGSGSVTGIKTYKLPEPFYYTLKLFTDSTDTITGLELKALDESTPNKILLGLTKAENELLKGLIITNSLTNARIFLVDLFEDGNQLVSAENILYQKYKAGIVGEKNDGNLELFLPATEVMVYSMDRKWHFSKGYSQYVKEELRTNLFLDLNITLDQA